MTTTLLPAITDAAVCGIKRTQCTAVPRYWKHQRRARLQLLVLSSSIEELAQTASFLELPVTPTWQPSCEAATWQEQLQRPGLLSGCEPARAPLEAALLLSGGVDSSLALKLLQAAGHRVTAFYLQIWFQEDFDNYWAACPWEDDVQVCQQVCEEAGVDLHVVPLTDQYWQQVVSHAVSEIKAGRTPNPDMLCNSRVKFGAFYDYLHSHHTLQFDRIASGHYAALQRGGTGQPVQLQLSPDAVKDQTYFLAGLSQPQLARCIFPLGALTKVEVRELAAAARLPNMQRRDSQGICFLGKVRFSDFVRRHLGTWPGPLIEEETNEVLGTHEGMWFYTPGQRKGILLSGGPWYVVRKNTTTNAVYLSRQYYSSAHARRCFSCGDLNWLDAAMQQHPPVRLQCKTRHGPKLYWCNVRWERQAEAATVCLDEDDQGLAPGQYAVFYLNGTCIASAVICDGALSDGPGDMQDVVSLQGGLSADGRCSRGCTSV